jgi:hypothetical membrane protein
MSNFTVANEKAKLGNLNSVLLFVSIAAIALILVGVVNSGTSLALVLLPAMLGAWVISDFKGVDTLNATILFLALVALAVVLVGVVFSGTSPVFILFPTILALWAESDLNA